MFANVLRWICVVLLFGGPAVGAAEFANPVVPTCLVPVDAAAGDFDQDGHADLAVACRFSDTVRLFRGSGDGAFSAWPSMTVVQPAALRVADFNGDGLADIVVATDGVSLLLGHGDGTFQAAIDYNTGSWPSDLALADLDADDQPDVIALGNDTVSVLGADGAGALTLVEQIPVGFTWQLAAGDFDNDGTPDVVATHAGEEEVFVLWGNGAGSLSAPVVVPAGGYPSDVATGDLDGDGSCDIVIGATSSSNRITVLFSNGDRTFESPAVVQSIASPRWLAVADMNLDGAADIVAAVNVPGDIQILPGNGDGTFGTPWRAPLAAAVETIAIAEMNGDGRPDVLAPRGLNGEDVSVLFGDGDGTLDVPPRFARGVPAKGIAAADLDDDGYTDVVIAGNVGQTTEYAALLGDGLGTFTVVDQSPTSSFPLDLALTRLDGDAHLDLSMATFNGIAIRLGNGGGAFGSESTVAAPNISKHVVGHWNADAHADLAAIDAFGDEIVLFFGDGSGGFAGETRVPIHSSADLLQQADLTGDGNPELIVNGYDLTAGSHVAVLPGNGDGTFAPAALISLGAYASGVAVADLDEDGVLDLAIVENAATLLIYPGNGNGTFGNAGPGRPFESGQALAAADVNGDGHVDVLTAVRGTISVLYGRGDATFEDERRFGAGDYPFDLVVAEINDDGMPDVLAADPTDGFATLVQRGAFLGSGSSVDALAWRSLAAATAYNVYRGDIADLNDHAGAPGYGACVAQIAGTGWTDLARPLPGEGFFYLVSYVIAGAESGAGHSSDGQPRILPPACQ